MQPLITVAICTYNRFGYLPLAIDSLVRQTLDAAAFEVLVLDNSSDQAAADAFWADYALPANARLVRTSPPGLSRARNIAYREARAPLLAYLDDDAIAEPGWLEAYLAYFAANPDVGVAGGPIDPIWPEAEKPAWLPGSFLECLSVLDLGDKDRHMADSAFGFGANLAFRTETLRQIGGFEESIGRIGNRTLLSNEEIIVQNRVCTEAGQKKGYAAKARVRHHVDAGRLSQNWFRSRLAWQAVSEILPGDEGGYSHGWNHAMLRSSAETLGLESFVDSFMNPVDATQFNQQLHFLRHFVGEMLNAKDIPDQIYANIMRRGTPTPLAAEKPAPVKVAEATITLPHMGSRRPHIFAEFVPGHRYLFDAYGLSDRTHLTLLKDNAWSRPMQFSLRELAKSLNCSNRSVTFLTLDPFLQLSQISALREFMAQVQIPVSAILHRLPTKATEIQHLRALDKDLANIFVLSEPFKERVEASLGLTSLRYLPHHPSKFLFTDVAGHGFRQQQGIADDRIVVSLVGELRRHKGLETLFAALPQLSEAARERLTFVVAGKATHYSVAEIEDAFKAAGCQYRILSGKGSGDSYIFLDAKHFTEILKGSDVGLLLYEGVQKDLTSGILSDYIWLNKPVIATATSMAGQDVIANGLGLVVPEQNSKGLATTLNSLSRRGLDFAGGAAFQRFRNSIAPQNTCAVLMDILDQRTDDTMPATAGGMRRP
ncbi:MAG: glycosyltransferase [Alphaproteobacteria bacterium]|nr:MAG: glycosyltransferase [Alphaproteobacteria bacterium]